MVFGRRDVTDAWSLRPDPKQVSGVRSACADCVLFTISAVKVRDYRYRVHICVCVCVYIYIYNNRRRGLFVCFLSACSLPAVSV